MKNIVCIVQARMTSTRLPNKVLLVLAGQPVLTQVFNQLSHSKLLTTTILATSMDSCDDPLEDWATKNNKKYFRGSLENVLDRFFETAKEYNADVIVRITADCPLIDPEIVDQCIDGFNNGDYDYYSNVNPPTFPDGLDTEVFSFAALEKAYSNAELKSEIEHVTPYIKNHPELFKIGNFYSEVNYEKLRWTLDNKEDYDFLSLIYKELFKPNSFISWKDVISFLNQNINLQQINAHIERNEGFIKSLNEDKKVK